MNMINFINHPDILAAGLPDEESCEVYPKAYCEKVGIRCKSCKSNTNDYWFSGG